jgi:hypothetical protein
VNSVVMPGEAIPLLAAIHHAAVKREEWRSRRRRMSPSHRIDPIDGLLVEFCAEILPDEGLDLYLGQFPKNDTRITTLSLGLFSSQSATTVITGSQTVANITESVWTNYARQALATATWGAQGATSPSTDGRKTTYPQVTYPTVGATGGTVNGFFLGWDTGAGGVATPTKAVGQANFDDNAAAVLLTNDVIKVTPTVQINH